MTSQSKDARASPHVGAAVLKAVDAEILEEQAASLARAGRRLEKALAVLSSHDAGGPPLERRRDVAQDRPALVEEARQALWYLIVQREACGFRNTEDVLGAYRVPPEIGRGIALPRIGRWRR